MAVSGVMRPTNKSPMLITGIRCLQFAPPEFLLGKLLQEVGGSATGLLGLGSHCGRPLQRPACVSPKLCWPRHRGPTSFLA